MKSDTIILLIFSVFLLASTHPLWACTMNYMLHNIVFVWSWLMNLIFDFSGITKYGGLFPFAVFVFLAALFCGSRLLSVSSMLSIFSFAVPLFLKSFCLIGINCSCLLQNLGKRLIFGKGHPKHDFGTNIKRKKLNKFKESAWKCVYFLSAELLVLYVSYDEPWFTDTKYFWVGPGDQVWPDQKIKWAPYPNCIFFVKSKIDFADFSSLRLLVFSKVLMDVMSVQGSWLALFLMLRLKLKGLYMYVAGFYSYSIFALLFWETRRSDFAVSMTHHIATVILVVLSYMFRWSKRLHHEDVISFIHLCFIFALVKSWAKSWLLQQKFDE